MTLKDYRKKRDFTRTPEPAGRDKAEGGGRLYVIQKHAASHLHYDLRLEVDGVLKSWAVPKGPSLDPEEKRLAMHVEDHPIEYGGFEGIIPAGEYGGGTVQVWDYGQWEPEDGDPRKAYHKGHLKFRLHGRKLKGGWALVRMQGASDQNRRQWLLIKHKDDQAVADDKDGILDRRPESALTGRLIDQVARDHDRVWTREQPSGSAADTGGFPASGPILDPADVPEARRADFPSQMRPQLAVAVNEPPEGSRWLHEIKFDGYRLLCLIRDSGVALMTRNGLDWSERFPVIVREAAALALRNTILDGEVVVQRADGTNDFQGLQNYLKGDRSGSLVYYVFDLPYLEGYDLTAVGLHRRKALLQGLMRRRRSAVIRFGDEIRGQGAAVYRRACELGVEGIVSKQMDAPYEQRRSASWVKTKCRLQQEFVIGGFSASRAAPGGLRSLLLGYYDPSGRLIFAGKVGTGFTEDQRRELKQILQKKARDSSAFANPPRERDLHWAEPELVAQIAFAQWTRHGRLRQPAFKGLREDKAVREVVRESADTRAGPSMKEAPSETPDQNRRPPALRTSTTLRIEGVALTHPGRELYAGSGITKEALARYYHQVSDRILPHLVERPLTLVRCPEGATQECFYQKHFSGTLPKAIKSIQLREKGKGAQRQYIYIPDVSGLIALAQIAALELHPWGSRIDRPDRPDTLIFDLDPDPDLAWEHVVQTAWYLKGMLQARGLSSFVKTSGGKGLHVQLPIEPTVDWKTLKDFAREVAGQLASAHPDRYTISARKAVRNKKIFIDYLRNARGATSIAPYSTRSRPGAPLSMPVAWEALDGDLRADSFSLLHPPGHLSGTDPWKDYFSVKNRLS